MKELKLTTGKIALIDDDDYDKISMFGWCSVQDGNSLYAIRRPVLKSGKRTRICMHTVIMGRPVEGYLIDHIDGDGLNNQKSNLRFVTKRQNGQNRHHKKTSKYPGVFRDGRSWRSQIVVGGKQSKLGSFKTEIDAFNAYRSAVNAIGQEVLEVISQ